MNHCLLDILGKYKLRKTSFHLGSTAVHNSFRNTQWQTLYYIDTESQARVDSKPASYTL